MWFFTAVGIVMYISVIEGVGFFIEFFEIVIIDLLVLK